MSLSQSFSTRKNRNILLSWFLTAAIILLAAAQLFGQVETGTISGTVRDTTGAVISGATVTVKSAATGAERSVQTGQIGQYLIPALTPGNYAITITSSTFKTYKTTVVVTVGGSATLDAKLQAGESSVVVEVVGGSSTEVNTSTQEISQLIDPQQMAQLPSLTRNPYDFVALSGNVSNGDSTTSNATGGQGQGSQNLDGRGVNFSLNGQRESGTEILLDGVENVNLFSVYPGQDIPIDSVQEYSVVSNNVSAEYGRAAGGVVNVTTKAGTNNFHGSAWEFNRLAAYTANTYNNDANDIPKGGYTRNQFGYIIGGPIVKNKLFISQSTEWTRIRSNSSQIAEIFDPGFVNMLPANTQAYFHNYGTTPNTSTSCVTAGQLAANPNGGPVGPINGTTPVAASQCVLDVVPFHAPFNAGGGLPGNQYTLVGRIDYNLSDKTQMFFRAARENNNQVAGTDFYSVYPQYNVGTDYANQSYLLSATHTFTPRVINNTKLSFTRFITLNTFNNAYTDVPNLMFVAPSDPVTGGVIQMPGLINLSEPGAGGLPYGGPQNTIQVADDLSWTKGKHNLKFGGTLLYIQINQAYGAYAQAVEQLGGTYQDSMNDLTNVAGDPLGSQLIGFVGRVDPQGKLPCVANPGYWQSSANSDLISNAGCDVTTPLSPADYSRSYRYKDWALYAQDSFRFTPRLTLNYGLRYEHYGVQHNDIQSEDSNFYFGPGANLQAQTRTGQVFLTQKSPVGQFWAPRWGTLAPRVGFAYDLFGNGKSSLRGGFGISYERNFGNVTYNASFNPPASEVLAQACTPSNPTCGVAVTTNGLGPLGATGLTLPLPPAEIRMPNPHIEVAQTQFWSLAVQQQVARNAIVELSYSGAHGTHLYDLNEINLIGAGQFFLNDPLTFAASPACVSPCLNRPNDQYANIGLRGSSGVSSYNAMNLKFQTQNLHSTGLSLVANYTWSHSLDELSSAFSDSSQGGSGFVGPLGYTDPNNPKLDWGSSDYDVRQRFVLSPIWETPWYKTGKGWRTNAAGGWSLVGVFTARTGTPFSIFDASNLYNGSYIDTPRLTPATPISQYKVGKAVAVGPNLFTSLNLPVPASFAPLDPALGISDFGPYPANMTHRNAFRGPGAWNLDMAAGKKFKVTEQVGLEFRAEGFNLLNHHNFYVNETNLQYSSTVAANLATPVSPLSVTELKGGLGSLNPVGLNSDERRFGQFSLRVSF